VSEDTEFWFFEQKAEPVAFGRPVPEQKMNTLWEADWIVAITGLDRAEIPIYSA
jgi:hypothetical protein